VNERSPVKKIAQRLSEEQNNTGREAVPGRPLSMNGAENWGRLITAKSMWRIAHPFFDVQKIVSFGISSQIKWLC
jgi:hypothetical protein